jgi:hypothetical protein
MRFFLSEEDCGGQLLTTFESSYAHLVSLFGEPNSEADRYKVSTEWVVQNDDGVVFTIYDYKQTNLYSSRLPSVESFRARTNYEWHIGGQVSNNRITLKLIQFIKSKENNGT